MSFRHALLAAGALFAALPACAQEVVTLKISHFLPAGAPTQQKVLEPWCETLKKESNGRIGCQFYPAMQLGGTPSQLADQVKNGVADVVWTAPGYSAGRFPRIEAFELPFVVTDAKSGSIALWKYYEKYAKEEFAAYHVLAFHVDGGQAVHTSTHAVVSVDDFKGLKLRTSTRLGARILTALGGTPVAMPPSQLTESISKGVVDGALGAWELVAPLKLDEVTKFHAQPPKGKPFVSATILMVLMNKEKYEGLPADLKALIDKTTGLAMSTRLGEVFVAETERGRNIVLSHGGSINEFTPEMIAAMKAATADVEAEWIKQVAGKGVDGKPLADAARSLVTETLAAQN